jgi:hypothetical protein
LQVLELIRGIRLHFGSFVKGLADGNLEKAQLGLGHSYSRAKVGQLLAALLNVRMGRVCMRLRGCVSGQIQRESYGQHDYSEYLLAGSGGVTV